MERLYLLVDQYISSLAHVSSSLRNAERLAACLSENVCTHGSHHCDSWREDLYKEPDGYRKWLAVGAASFINARLSFFDDDASHLPIAT